MELLGIIRKIKRLFEIHLSSRKRFLLCLLFCLGFMLYVGPSLFRFLRRRAPIIMDTSIGSVMLLVDPYSNDLARFDAYIHRSFESDPYQVPFVGNGKVGYNVETDELYAYYNKSLSLRLPFKPGVQLTYEKYPYQEATVIHYVKGQVSRFRAYSRWQKTITQSSTFYAHRVHSSLLIQHVKLVNPLVESITFALQHRGSSDEQLVAKALNRNAHEDFDSLQWLGRINLPNSKNFIVFSVISAKVGSEVIVENKSSTTLTIVTHVHYSDPITTGAYHEALSKVETAARDEFYKLMETERHVMRRIHADAWAMLWRSGLTISLSKAHGALNGDLVNATMYYMLSNARAYTMEVSSNFNEVASKRRLLYSPDGCYAGHPTLQAHKLWKEMDSIETMWNIISLWTLTLQKQGCKNLIESGAEGVLQAMLLSFGAFRFGHGHLGFNTQPRDLHRDFFYRALNFGNATRLNISIVVNHENKAVLRASKQSLGKPVDVFACDAGCLDQPMQLTSKMSVFPVKLTEPMTAVFYVSSSRAHLVDLRQVLHVHEVQEAPAHEHHLIALHRHGHQLGGLPALFWVSIAFLIVIFHLFLAKLICNEYCGSGSSSSSGGGGMGGDVSYHKLDKGGRSNRYNL